MKATIGVYDTHEKAMNAVKELKDAGFPVKHISVIGEAKTEQIDEDMHVTEISSVKAGGVEAGAGVGITLGILTGIGIIAIPGFGFLFGAGALAGAIAGFDFGLIGGGLASVLISLGMRENVAKEYQKALEQGNYLVVAQGSDDELRTANNILAKHATHAALQTH
jgi:hypothetical protein